VITITTLKESKGKPVAALFVHIYREQIPVGAGNGAAKNKVLPIQFMLKLEGMARPWGDKYIRDIATFLKNEFRRLDREAKIDTTEWV
jgi:hypothetical protein